MYLTFQGSNKFRTCIHIQYAEVCIEKSCRHLVSIHPDSHKVRDIGMEKMSNEKKIPRKKIRTNTIKYTEPAHLLRSIAHSKQICCSNFVQIRFRIFPHDRICLQMNRFQTPNIQTHEERSQRKKAKKKKKNKK